MKTKSNEWLTPRECEVVGRLALGESFKWIAYAMGIKTSTATEFARKAYRKLGARDRFEAVALHPRHKPTPSRMCHVRHVVKTPPTPSI